MLLIGITSLICLIVYTINLKLVFEKFWLRSLNLFQEMLVSLLSNFGLISSCFDLGNEL